MSSSCFSLCFDDLEHEHVNRKNKLGAWEGKSRYSHPGVGRQFHSWAMWVSKRIIRFQSVGELVQENRKISGIIA